MLKGISNGEWLTFWGTIIAAIVGAFALAIATGWQIRKSYKQQLDLHKTKEEVGYLFELLENLSPMMLELEQPELREIPSSITEKEAIEFMFSEIKAVEKLRDTVTNTVLPKLFGSRYKLTAQFLQFFFNPIFTSDTATDDMLGGSYDAAEGLGHTLAKMSKLNIEKDKERWQFLFKEAWEKAELTLKHVNDFRILMMNFANDTHKYIDFLEGTKDKELLAKIKGNSEQD